MKTQIRFKNNDQYNEWQIGDEGYIDGYCRAADDRAYACVVIPKKSTVVQAPVHSLEVLNKE